jgi:hypothetical protein
MNATGWVIFGLSCGLAMLWLFWMANVDLGEPSPDEEAAIERAREYLK